MFLHLIETSTAINCRNDDKGGEHIWHLVQNIRGLIFLVLTEITVSDIPGKALKQYFPVLVLGIALTE